MSNKGAFFVANDGIYDLAIAFLNSFRIHNPTLPLCLIPYRDDIERISKLATKYNFSIFDDQSLLARCDEMSRQIHGRVFGHYRKFVAWHGPFDEFIYMDTDTVVTSDVTFAYDFLKDYAFIFSHSDAPYLKRFVWNKGIDATGALTPEQIRFSTNTGYFCSAKGTLTLDEVEGKLTGALELVDHMALFCIEQPFMNYVVVTSGKPYTSIWNIAKSRSLDIPVEKWGGERLRLQRMENCRTLEHRVFMVHWAGVWKPTNLELLGYDLVRKLGFKAEPPPVRHFMRNRELWNYYRFMPEEVFASRVAPAAS